MSLCIIVGRWFKIIDHFDRIIAASDAVQYAVPSLVGVADSMRLNFCLLK